MSRVTAFRVMMAILYYCSVSLSYADSAKSAVLAVPVNNAKHQVLNEFSQPTDHPSMTLVKGNMLYVDILPNVSVNRDSVHNGTGYLVVQYHGKEQLGDSATFIVRDLADLTPITEITFFAKLAGGTNSGSISLNDLLKTNVGLINYNSHGYVVIQGLAGYNINSVHYDTTKNVVEFLSGRENRIALSGGIVNFK